MIDLTKPVQTRTGLAVRIVATDALGEYPVIALVSGDNLRESVVKYTRAGQVYSNGISDSLDLQNVKYPHHGEGVRTEASAYPFRRRAFESCNENICLGQVKLTFQDGKLTAIELCPPLQ